ncbi:VOC family protein [Legionella sp. PATHC035]|uniref:bleomycin resistance protein n=1 Tax=Legionella sp. PATHC035 TaxID=2992040 RepID=UPI002244E214|nr:VOC family protein [Legionella sp. PATHC035]MCW8409584.1 VOC family protein [Legionella sp. PATHC035]
MNNERLTTALIPELYCSDIDLSLSFYTEVLGFTIQYQRAEEQFAMLERQGARLMLEEIKHVGRIWVTAPLEAPFGRGINLQIKTTEVEQLYRHIQRYKINLFMPIEDRWYQAGDLKIGQRQFIILDPDGYMLRFAEDLGDKI